MTKDRYSFFLKLVADDEAFNKYCGLDNVIIRRLLEVGCNLSYAEFGLLVKRANSIASIGIRKAGNHYKLLLTKSLNPVMHDFWKRHRDEKRRAKFNVKFAMPVTDYNITDEVFQKMLRKNKEISLVREIVKELRDIISGDVL